MCSMRTAQWVTGQWVTRSIVVTAIIAVLSGCSALEPSTLVVTFPDSSDSTDAVADPVPDPAADFPAPSEDVKLAISDAVIAVSTFMVQSPGVAAPQADGLADYGLDLSKNSTTVTIFNAELSAFFCIQGDTPTGFSYKYVSEYVAVNGVSPIVAGTCVEGTDY